VEGTRLVVFQMTVGKEHRFGQSHSHFDDIKSPRHPSSESKLLLLFLFVVPDESFPSFRIDLKGSDLRDDVDVRVMRIPISERFVKGIQE
jgi:hypothetical protein